MDGRMGAQASFAGMWPPGNVMIWFRKPEDPGEPMLNRPAVEVPPDDGSCARDRGGRGLVRVDSEGAELARGSRRRLRSFER